VRTDEFESVLSSVVDSLQRQARVRTFESSKDFEQRVREEIANQLVRIDRRIKVDLNPPGQSFPDIAIPPFGVEVKFTANDTWLSIANSVLETNRVSGVEKIYIVFGKMGGLPEVRWARYEDCVVHVRTSHVPRFEVEVPPSDGRTPLFVQLGVKYSEFQKLPMDAKMKHIREYARARLKRGERLWWLEDTEDPEHALPIQARLYTKLSTSEKIRLRAEAVLLCPRVVEHGRSRDKYDDVVLYLLTYHGVLCHQARDLFSAGSVANPDNDDLGGIYIQRAIKLIEEEMIEAAHRLEDALFIEYWGRSVKPERRISEWVKQADQYARDWTPSKTLFQKPKNGNQRNKS
jgi:hypothetical protein